MSPTARAGACVRGHQPPQDQKGLAMGAHLTPLSMRKACGLKEGQRPREETEARPRPERPGGCRARVLCLRYGQLSLVPSPRGHVQAPQGVLGPRDQRAVPLDSWPRPHQLGVAPLLLCNCHQPGGWPRTAREGLASGRSCSVARGWEELGEIQAAAQRCSAGAAQRGERVEMRGTREEASDPEPLLLLPAGCSRGAGQRPGRGSTMLFYAFFFFNTFF